MIGRTGTDILHGLLFYLGIAIMSVESKQQNNSVFTTFPTSTSVPLKENATFLCSGTGQDLFWAVDGVNALLYKGAEYRTNIHSNNFRESKLNVSGTTENNNISIICYLIVGKSLHKSPSAYLTVLGIGSVSSLNFNFVPFPPCVEWAEPFSSMDIVGPVLYNISITGPDTTTFATTNHTHFCAQLTPCVIHFATVTPFSLTPPYSAEASHTANGTTPGDDYHLEREVSTEIEFGSNSNCNISCTLICTLLVPRSPCLNQSIVTTTMSYNAKSVIADTVLLVDPSSIDASGRYNITITGLCKEMIYFSNLTLRNSSGFEINETSVNFTTYSVQKLKTVPSNEMAAVTVQCFFAVNAPAQGCLVVFSNLSFTFNETIIRFNNTTKAEKTVAVPKTLLSNASYLLFHVRAYDYYMNQAVNLSNPAVILYDQVSLTITPSISTTPSQSTVAVSTTPSPMSTAGQSPTTQPSSSIWLSSTITVSSTTGYSTSSSIGSSASVTPPLSTGRPSIVKPPLDC